MADVELGKEACEHKFDPLEVKNKQDGYRYRFANKKHTLERRLAEGWEVVNPTTGNKEKLSDNPRVAKVDSGDGTRQVRDVILMRMPEDLARKRYDDPNREKIRRRTEGATAEYNRAARETNTSTFDERGRDPRMRTWKEE